MNDQDARETGLGLDDETVEGLDDDVVVDSPDFSLLASAPGADPVADPAAGALAGQEQDDPIAVSSTTPQAETEVTCPGCGLTLLGHEPRPTAAWFCPRCDYPLFWATEPPPAQPASRAARQRLPGTGGRVVLGAQPCWHCGEMSSLDDRECGRCAATLPKPDAPKVFVDVPVPIPVPIAVQPIVWPWIASALCAGAAIAAAVTSWLSGG